jgi:nucleotide-binding universal stress UspA family protein
VGHQELEPLGVAGAVVVGDDGSAESQVGLRWAAADAARRGVELVVLRAWTITRAPRPKDWEPGYVPSEDEFAAAVDDELQGDVRRALGDAADFRTLAVHASPESALVTASREAACVVVASHGRHLARALLGSTAEHVVRYAHGPVVVVPARSR